MESNYTFGTGEGGIWSEDGWTWQGGAVRPGRGAAPDVLKIGDRYLVATVLRVVDWEAVIAVMS